MSAIGPTTSVLDNFDRSNTGPPLSSSWTDLAGGNKVVSNEAAGNTASFNFSYYNPGTYGADEEAYITITTKPANGDAVGVYVRMKDVGSVATVDGYLLGVIPQSGTDIIRMQRIDNAVATTLGADFSQEVSTGDKIMLRAIGSTLEAWYCASGGSWTLLGTRTDTTYAAGGYLGLLIQNTACRVNDFGGGTYNAVEGNASITLGTMTASAAGTVETHGAASITLGAMTASAAGTVEIHGTAAITFGAMTGAGTGTVETHGTADITLGAMTVAAAGGVEVAGSGSVAFGTMTLAATGNVEVVGTGAIAFGAMTVTADGDVDIVGTAAITFGAMTVSADGTVTEGVTGSADITFGAMTISAAGTVENHGVGGIQFGAMGLTAAGKVDVTGQAAATFGAMTLHATGSVGGDVADAAGAGSILIRSAGGGVMVVTSAGGGSIEVEP